MKAIGIVRRIDGLGRVVIPKEIRRTMGITEGDPVEIFVNEGQIILRKYRIGCSVCGQDKPTTKLYPDKPICAGCVSIIVRDAEKLRTEISDHARPKI